MKGKTAALLAYGVLVLCLAFTLGYLLGSGSGETKISVTTVEAAPQKTIVIQAEETEEVTEEKPLNLNTATQSQLEQLPGVGPELAKRILAYREENSRFVAKEQLMDVEGIGEKRYATLEPLICVGDESS